MFDESDPSKDHPDPAPSNPKPLDLDKSAAAAAAAIKGGSSAPQELTLSYLCENPKLTLQDKDQPDPFAAMERPRASNKGKEIAAAAAAASEGSPGDDDRRWVERDFLQLAGGKREAPPDRADAEGGGAGREKKVKVETLSLSLGPPNLSLSLKPSANPVASSNTLAAAPGAAAAAPTPAVPSSVVAPLKRTYSSNTRTTNSDDYGAASFSYSYSIPFSHNPSCSLTRNSTENYDFSRENDQMWYAGEGTNGSVHSRFKPVGDGHNVAFTNPSGFSHVNNKELNNSLHRGHNSSDNVSFFPSELPARPPVKINGVLSSDSGRNAILPRTDRLLREIVSESIPVMAQILQELPAESLEALREALRNLIDSPERKDDCARLQRRLEQRSDLTFEMLSKSNRAQLEILVAIKTGVTDFVSGKVRVPSNELVEIFLLMRCKNLDCKNLLPVDDCDCNICSSKKGFCSTCMCPICLRFDCASNTCSWVGCDVCSHWCHAVCGLEKNLIRPGPTRKGPMGTSEMQFHCLGCGHASEMFGFVKEVFTCCAKQWGLETLVKELGYVRKIFRASEDFEGKGLHGKSEEILNMLGKNMISPPDACNSMLHFFKYGVTEFSVTGSTSKNTIAAQASQLADILPLQTPVTTPPKSAFNFKPTSSVLNNPIDVLKCDPKPHSIESHFTPSKEDDFRSLETIVKFKEAEAKLFQRLADDARREVENYRQIVRANSEKLEEEYAAKLAKLCFQETEEKRRKKVEELKLLENSQCDYHKMKMRMQEEIARLLERMEATKKMWV
ncbi:protein OBERON 3 [Ananas comosus]|uniref:Protein OBERON 3 n=2 Tax=Ananas comosus TaxID=4615 RepID=A0A6P5GG57_ANACO|nr:protein OBERON 3 [Ananas comosus]